jgi:glycosyltransferase involved in cell wall biosynthesis
VIHNGIDCEQFAPTAADGGFVPDAVDNSTENPYVAFVGRLQPGKGAHYLIDAFARIADSYPERELVLVGDGPQREELEALAREREVRDRVEFLGEIPNEAIPLLLVRRICSRCRVSPRGCLGPSSRHSPARRPS